MEKLIIRKAISKDKDRIFEIFESQDTKWDIPYAKQYYDNYFNNDTPDDMVFAGEIDGKIVSVRGYSLDKTEIDDVYWLNWHYTHKDFEGKGISGKILEHMIEILSQKSPQILREYGLAIIKFKST